MKSFTRAIWCVSVFCLLAAVGCGEKPVGGVVVVEHTSAKMLVMSVNEAAQHRDYTAMVQAMDKDFRTPYRTMLYAARDYVASLSALADTVEKKIGPEQAARFRKRADDIYANFMPSPVEGAIFEGKVNWEVVGIVDGTESSRVIVGGRNTEFDRQYVLRKVKDEWFISPRQLDIPPAQRVKSYAREANLVDSTFGKYVKMTDDLRKKFNSGEINKDNFHQKMAALSASATPVPMPQRPRPSR